MQKLWYCWLGSPNLTKSESQTRPQISKLHIILLCHIQNLLFLLHQFLISLKFTLSEFILEIPVLFLILIWFSTLVMMIDFFVILLNQWLRYLNLKKRLFKFIYLLGDLGVFKLQRFVFLNQIVGVVSKLNIWDWLHLLFIFRLLGLLSAYLLNYFAHALH